jgi:hypothetical protein
MFFTLTIKITNKDSSTETHFKSSETSRGFYLDLEVFIFVKYLNSIQVPIQCTCTVWYPVTAYLRNKVQLVNVHVKVAVSL